MTNVRLQFVRLFAAVLGSVFACWFALLYSRFSRVRFEIEHSGGQLTAVNEVLLNHGQWLFAFPISAVILGGWLLLSRDDTVTAFEILLSIIWLASLAIGGLSILSWQIQNIPTFSGMELRY